MIDSNLDNSGRESTPILIQDASDSQNLLNEEKNNKIKKFIIILIIVIIVLAILALILYFVLKDDSSFTPYNPIPEKEDLDFTEEKHRLLSREVATQTMVLATNNGELPLLKSDQVVLFKSPSTMQ